MDDPQVQSAPDSGSGTQPSGGTPRTKPWVTAAMIAVGLVLCGCASTVFLVLTGIIAEPETVIEQIIRAVAR